MQSLGVGRYSIAQLCVMTDSRLGSMDQFHRNFTKSIGKHGWNKIAAPVKEAHAFDEKMTNLLESVWATYGDKSGNELEALTHTEAPWQAARIGLHPDDACHNVISPQTMRQFYLSIYSGD